MVTSVSVVLNGQEPQFADAAGNYIPRPLVPPHVASPINLLNPDRYEFYTFNDDGDLVKRLMTMKEIQSIVANGDSEQQLMAKNPTGELESEKNIRDIVNNVQKVLHKEIEGKANLTINLMHNKLDTPDTSSSWSSILPAIFGNTGEPILSNKTVSPAIAITPDSEILRPSKKPIVHKTTATSTTLTKQKQKPLRRTTAKPLSTQKIKNNENKIPVKIINNVPLKDIASTVKRPHQTTHSLPTKSNTIKNQTPTRFSTVTGPTKSNTGSLSTKFHGTAGTITRLPSFGTTSNSQKLVTSNGISSTRRPVQHIKITPTTLNSISSPKPLQLVGTKAEVAVKRPISLNKISNKVTVGLKSSTHRPNIVRTSSDASTTSTTQNNRISIAQTSPTLAQTNPPPFTSSTLNISPSRAPTTTTKSSSNKRKTTMTSESKIKTKSTTTAKIPTTTLEARSTTTATTPYITEKLLPTSTDPVTTKTNPTSSETINHPTEEFADSSTELMPNIFDSDFSLNQIIESLKDAEATTMQYNQNYMNEMFETTTFDRNTVAPPVFDNVNTESVTIYNNGEDFTTHTNIIASNLSDFKQTMGDRVTYIPHTTVSDADDSKEPSTIKNTATELYAELQHKESADDLENLLGMKNINENSVSDGSNSMDNILRESFDNVLLQIRNDPTTTTDYNESESTTILAEHKTQISNLKEKKKIIVKPTPNILMDDELRDTGTEPLKYFENVVNELAKEKAAQVKNKTNEMNLDTTRLQTTIDDDNRSEQTESNFIEVELLSTITDRFLNDLSTTQTTFEENTSDLTEFDAVQSTEKIVYSTEKNTINDELDATTLTQESSTNKVNELEMTTTNLWDDVSTIAYTDIATTLVANDSDLNQNLLKEVHSTSLPEEDDSSTQYQLVELIENVSKNLLVNDSTENMPGIEMTKPTTNQTSMERKEDSQEQKNERNRTESPFKREENVFLNLGEATTFQANIEKITEMKNDTQSLNLKSNPSNEINNGVPIKSVLDKLQTALDNLSIGKLPPTLNSFKKKITNTIKKSSTIQLDPAPKQALGLEESTLNANEDILEFTRFCNEVAFDFWRALNNDGISSARSLILSPFALTSMLAMVFLGARGRTSGEINDLLHLDDIVTFNPHAIFRNITDSVESKNKNESNVLTSAFVREILSDRSKGKILSFYKEKVQQFYSGYVEEVNFNTINDIIRRRTNLLVKRHTAGKIPEYLKTNNVWVKTPFAGISANIFETDCSNASKDERDGEMFFQVLPAIRQRRLVPIPAVVWKSGFSAGYDPELDATAVAIGPKDNVISTVFVMPGQQGHSAPGDNLERLESVLMVNAVTKNAWRRLLATLMERPGLEVQIPRFTHHSFINTTNALHKLGLKSLFDSNNADLRGITGSTTRDMYVSDLLQINTFSTCGEDKLAEQHHVEMYPAPPNKYRTMHYDTMHARNERTSTSTSTLISTSTSTESVFDSQRSFSDPLFDLTYLNLPLPLRPRQARIPEVPRLRFDKPFIYFVRHNPTGMVLYMGRFNPRLLP